MRKTIALALSTVALLWAPAALPCGGGFGYGLKLNPDQKIVLRHKAGVETYFFSPHFCGQSAHFGLILPVASQLVVPPKKGDAATVSQLEDLTQATVVHRTLCYSHDRSTGGVGSASNGSHADGGAPPSVQVIDKGKVDIFDYTVLKADTAKAFTDWLDANHYPYDPSSSSQFSAYVTNGWYFVAFKVTADAQDPPQGKQICGDLGPIQVAFQTEKPVIPARIAAASSAGDAGLYTSQLQWRVFAIAEHQLTTSVVSPSLRFSGALSDGDISKHSALNGLTIDEEHLAGGERLTELDFNFYPGQITSDLLLQSASSDTDYRRTEYVDSYVECPDGGLDAGGAGAGGALVADAGTGGKGGLGNAGGAAGKGGAAGGAPGAGGAAGKAGSLAAAGGAAGATTAHSGGAVGKGGAGGSLATTKGGAAGTTEPDPGPESHGGCSVSSLPASANPLSAWAYGLAAAVCAWGTRRRNRSRNRDRQE